MATCSLLQPYFVWERTYFYVSPKHFNPKKLGLETYEGEGKPSFLSNSLLVGALTPKVGNHPKGVRTISPNYLKRILAPGLGLGKVRYTCISCGSWLSWQPKKQDSDFHCGPLIWVFWIVARLLFLHHSYDYIMQKQNGGEATRPVPMSLNHNSSDLLSFLSHLYSS